jgi:hypothetical protein
VNTRPRLEIPSSPLERNLNRLTVALQNAERMYRGGRRFLVWLNFGLAILFLVVESSTVLAAMKEEKAKAATRPPASVGRSTQHLC